MINLKNKKLIAIFVLLAVVIVSGVFVWQKKESIEKKNEKKNDNVDIISNIDSAETGQGNENEEDENSYDFLSEEEKSELVWYEVPELGVRFKVTPDYKNDVKYYIKRSKNNVGEDTAHAFFYSQSEIDFENVDIDFNEDNEERDNYTLGILSVRILSVAFI